MEGWIKIHRKLIDWEWYNDNNTKIVFLHLLLTANHKDKKWQGITILRGQKLTSLQHLADETNLTVQQVRTSLNKLKSTNEITIKSTSKNTLITIEKYSDYQDNEEENNKQSNTQINNQITNNQQTNNKQITTNKNEKNIKNDKNEKNIEEKKKSFNEVFIESNLDVDVEKALKDFIDMRKALKKPMTTRALELLIRNLQKLTNLKAEQIDIINQSIEHGWQTVYPLKKNITKIDFSKVEDF